LPSFEYPISDLVPALSAQGAQGYRMDAYFEGTSAWFGYQGNIAYQINDMISVALGARFVQAKDTYNGYLRNVELNMGGAWMPASNVMYGIASTIATNLQPLIDGGGGSLTLDQAIAAGYMDQSTAAQIINGVGDSYTNEMTINDIQPRFANGQNTYSATGTILEDQSAETEATATGITPIISVNIKPNDQFNFSLKYEHQTKLEFTYETAKDFTTGFQPDGTPITKFPDGTTYQKDMPSQLVVGATYKPMDNLLISTGYHMYLDKNADWNGAEDLVDNNSWEFGLGVEYSLSESLAASLGWLTTKSGVSEAYQSDLSFSLPSNTFGGGLEYKINEMVAINLGGSYTMYKEGSKNFDHDFANTGVMQPITETYTKPIWIAALGVNFNFGK
jgi:long-subunit fatty acid transport protein